MYVTWGQENAETMLHMRIKVLLTWESDSSALEVLFSTYNS